MLRRNKGLARNHVTVSPPLVTALAASDALDDQGLQGHLSVDQAQRESLESLRANAVGRQRQANRELTALGPEEFNFVLLELII